MHPHDTTYLDCARHVRVDSVSKLNAFRIPFEQTLARNHNLDANHLVEMKGQDLLSGFRVQGLRVINKALVAPEQLIGAITITRIAW